MAPPEVVVLVGLQGSGKSTFYRQRFAATHALVSRDLFRNNPRPSRRQRELLDGALRDTVRTAYLLCRTADALEDSWPGPPAEIAARFAAFVRAIGGDGAEARALAGGAAARAGGRDDLALVAHLPLVLEALGERPEPERAIVREAVRTMADGMSRYAARAAARAPGACYLDDDAELADYCWVVAGCVGVMLTRLFELRLGDRDRGRERRHALAPVVGEALQLTNIVLDLPGDVRRGRCYLPASGLAPAGLAPAALVAAPNAGARALTQRLAARAHAALDRVADDLDPVPRRHVRYRLFCLWPALWARASIRLAHGDPRFPLEGRPKLTRGQLWSVALRSLLVLPSARGTRRLLAG